MAKLNEEWFNAFRGCFQDEEDVIEFIFENLNTDGWEESFVDVGGNGEANECFKITVEDKKDLLYEFVIDLMNRCA